MRKYFLFGLLFAIAQACTAQRDTLYTYTTTGYFTGYAVNVGYPDTLMAYQFNRYYIAVTDLTPVQVDSFRDKQLTITGKLRIQPEVKRYIKPATPGGKVYEPYIDPEKLVLIDPKFSLTE